MSDNDCISRSALRSQMYHEAFETDTDMQKWDGGCWIRYKLFENCIESAPPAEQPKAKNIGADYGEQDQFICSECGIHLQDWVRIDEDDYEDGVVHEYVFRFCPNCGRRIDDER